MYVMTPCFVSPFASVHVTPVSVLFGYYLAKHVSYASFGNVYIFQCQGITATGSIIKINKTIFFILYYLLNIIISVH